VKCKSHLTRRPIFVLSFISNDFIEFYLQMTSLMKEFDFVIPYLCVRFCMGVKPGLSHYGKNIDWGCLKTGCLGEYLDLRGMKWQEVGEKCIMRSCMICTLSPVLLGWSKQGGWDGRGMWRAWGRWGVRTFWFGGLKGRDH
jgi:hypothetical protein